MTLLPEKEQSRARARLAVCDQRPWLPLVVAGICVGMLSHCGLVEPHAAQAETVVTKRPQFDKLANTQPIHASASSENAVPGADRDGELSDFVDQLQAQDERPYLSSASDLSTDEPKLQRDGGKRAPAEYGLQSLIDPQRLSGTLQLAASVTITGFVPALLLLTTSYIRITIVLSLLRQAFGSQQLLPAQVTTALAFGCTALIMWPTWTQSYEAATAHLTSEASSVELKQAWDAGVMPVREFMVRQIDERDNADDIHLFLTDDPESPAYPATYDEVPLRALFPAYLISELKTAFEIGLRIYLPFLVIDLVMASLTTSLGMFMLPPAMISLPLKLLLFLLVDGWHLVIEMLIQSFV